MRILATKDNPKGTASELDWINSRVRLLGESFGRASAVIEEMVRDGDMIVVQEASTPS